MTAAGRLPEGLLQPEPLQKAGLPTRLYLLASQIPKKRS